MEAKWQALIIVSIGIFISTLDGSILNIANPIIAKALQVSLKQVQWVVTAYMLIITVSLLFFGKLGDRVGGSRVYTGGFLVFSLGSAFCSVSPTLAILVTARILQGIGASMMMATGVGIVANAFPAGERGKALGLTGSVVGLGNMAGPGLGGILMANFAWPVVFLINIPIGLTGFILGCKYLPRNQVKEKFKGNDGGGFFLFALASAAMLLSISAFEKHQGWILLLALLLLAGFYVYEKKPPSLYLTCPFLKLKLFCMATSWRCCLIPSRCRYIFCCPFTWKTF
jgi:MFS family permease